MNSPEQQMRLHDVQGSANRERFTMIQSLRYRSGLGVLSKWCQFIEL